MLRKSRIFSRLLKILVPLAIVAMPFMSFAASNPASTTVSPAYLTKALSAHGTMAGENGTPIGMNLVTSLDRVPTAAGDKVNVIFTVTNTAPARTKASLNNVVLSSRLLATDNKNLTIYTFPMELMADAHYSGYLPYTYDGSQNIDQLLSSVTATARFDIYQYNEILTTADPTSTTVPRYTGPKVRSSTQTDTYWGRFELTVGFDKTPEKAGEARNIIFTVKSGNSIPGDKPRPNQLRGITLYSRLLSVPGQAPTDTVLHAFPQTITETNEITWSMPYVYQGNENLVALLSSVSGEGTASFSTYTVTLVTGQPIQLPSDPLPPTTPTSAVTTSPTTTPPTNATTAPPTNATTAPPTNATTAPPTNATTAPPTNATTAPPTNVTTSPTTTPTTAVPTSPTNPATTSATNPATTSATNPATTSATNPATTSATTSATNPSTSSATNPTTAPTTVATSTPATVLGTSITQTTTSATPAGQLPFTGSQTGLVIWWGLVLMTAGYLLNGAIKYRKAHSHS